ncbi:MAG TPA: phosphate ABC transporter permease subunit PstC [Bryobacteraceae bacterium]|jgi:phosphate transport system permease protein|nr:phosphate ABC transporter permease subunit PstC [Bryobacteraceae bacterium]HWZ29831.1 phosphate ABC transporter permease subunit PstC [Bryobacteraceae bacterium]
MAASSSTAIDAPPGGWAHSFVKRLRAGDEIAYLLTFICAASVVAITALLVWELYINSYEARVKFGWSFLWTTTWDPVNGQFGALPFVYGTLVTSGLAMLIGIPLGVGAAIFLAELAPPRISSALTFLIELLAAVPSVIFGLLGIFILVPALRTAEPALRAVLGWTPLFQGAFYGVSLFSAGVVLAVMIIPFIISISREVILAVPGDQREGALALGATRWETTWDVVVPFARKGIAGSIFLALARSLGETMAVTMVVGNETKIHASLFAPGYSIAAVLANEFVEATGPLHLSALTELGLVLFALTIVINGAARILVASTSGKGMS